MSFLGTKTKEKKPDSEISYLEPAQAAERGADYKTAVGLYQRLYSQDPSKMSALLALARNFRYIGRGTVASRLLETRKADFGKNADYLLELGKAYIAANKPAKAEHTLRQVLNSPDLPQWQVLGSIAIAYDIQNKFDQSAKAYKAAMALEPDRISIANNYGLSLAQSGKLADGIAVLEAANRRDRHNAQIRQNLALLYGVKGDLARAEAMGRMDLDEKALQNNLSFFKRFPDQ